MSSDDGNHGENGERGWWDDLQDEWNQDSLIYEYNNPDAPEGWQQWEQHDLEGSHWTIESERFSSYEDALNILEDMRDNPGDYLEGENNPGNFSSLEIRIDQEADEYYIEGEAYVEY